MFAGNFAPAGWMFCEGQLLPISEYETLFNLIGTTYGGDGQSTFQLPDLRGRLPIHQGSLSGATFTLAETGGVETVRLTIPQIPSHTHPVLASTNGGSQPSPVGFVPAANNVVKLYTSLSSPLVPMPAQAILNTGGSMPHDNFQPYLCIDFIISLFGVYPSPT
jgi:microcystin-dependent protein